MRIKKQYYSARTIISEIARELYNMSPINRPRNTDKIMGYVINNIESKCIDITTSRYMCMAESEFEEYIAQMLMNCPEFCELNLTHNEIINGITLNDERPRYSFTNVFDIPTAESWKNDFIDLDAFIRNVLISINKHNEPTECCLCDNEDTDICEHCRLHYNNKYHHANKPGDTERFNGWCDTECPEHIAVCCKDCYKYIDCKESYKCTESPDTCNQYIKNNNKK